MRDLRRRFPEKLRNWQKSRLWTDRRSPEMAGIPEETMAQSLEMAEMLEKITAQSLEMVEIRRKQWLKTRKWNWFIQFRLFQTGDQ